MAAAIETSGTPALAAWRPRANPWLITIAVMLGTFMEVLDTSVANVALPHIAGSLAASVDEATWVLTSYLVSNAIVLPATGWLSRTFGRKNFLMFCVALFTLASFLCGAATTLPLLIAARILQGAGGGALQPIAQAILLESFPHAKRGAAMAAYTLGIVFAPIIGPTLGGWITDNYSWRWVFYINIPVGALALFMVWSLIEDPPYIKNAIKTKIDTWGLGLMAIWLAAFQIIMDKGQEADWFNSTWIRYTALISGAAFVGFILRELLTRSPIVSLRVIANRNFAIGITVVTVVGIVLYGTTALIPEYLQGLMGYTATQSGLTVSPRGIGSITAILLVSRLMKRLDSRFLIAGGLLLLGYSSWLLGNVYLGVSPYSITYPIILNGAAVSMLFVPLSVLTTGTLRNEEMGNATGLYNLLRNIGASVGISMTTTLLVREAQSHQTILSAHITPYDPQTAARVQELMAHGMQLPQALGSIYHEMLTQANVWGFVSNFRLMAILCFAAAPLALLFKKTAAPKGPVAAH
ncbi:MAG TPA: DHA2 family efflux MFS transporter permease subunit [Phycisphaerae bacterium]|nr:DHA2 family efflux MFS transporter permease subunit [Phycisphaerae bacterium]